MGVLLGGYLSCTLPLSSPMVTVTVRTRDRSKAGSCWWKSGVTQPTQTLEGSCPAKIRTE